jgi:sulfur carrier protein ThiS
MTMTRIRTVAVTIEEPKIVCDLLSELKLSEQHIVLVNGKRAALEDRLNEDDLVVILPLIGGG